MKKIAKPEINYEDVLDACIESMQPSSYKSLFSNNKNVFIESRDIYDRLGCASRLGEFINHSERITTIPKVRKEIVNLYEKFKTNKAPSVFHEELLLMSNKCVYCNMVVPESLDHYLPKEKFPLLSINPLNLIPSCFGCNNRLNAVSGLGESLIIHPYFDGIDLIYDQQWIFATLPEDQAFFTNNEYGVIELKFGTNFDNMNIDAITKEKLKFQFDTLICDKYEAEASEVISSEIKRLEDFSGTPNTQVEENKRHLLRKSKYYPVNSYNNVIYKALSDSELFLQAAESKFSQFRNNHRI